MPMVSWGCTKYYPGGHGTLIGTINSFVHIIMYTYYMLAAMGPQFQKYLWWKKYITTLQMVKRIKLNQMATNKTKLVFSSNFASRFCIQCSCYFTIVDIRDGRWWSRGPTPYFSTISSPIFTIRRTEIGVNVKNLSSNKGRFVCGCFVSLSAQVTARKVAAMQKENEGLLFHFLSTVRVSKLF